MFYKHLLFVFCMTCNDASEGSAQYPLMMLIYGLHVTCNMVLLYPCNMFNYRGNLNYDLLLSLVNRRNQDI